jgi:flagellar secretion chaperone FliS
MIEGDLYLKSNLEGMNNDELILFIYQEMLRILNQVNYYFEKKEIESRVAAINKGIEILTALISILNFEAGGEIAVRLRSLYIYSMKKLTSANFDRDSKPVEEVIRIFKELYSGWAQKIENDRKSNSVNPAVNVGVPAAGPEPQRKMGLEIYG